MVTALHIGTLKKWSRKNCGTVCLPNFVKGLARLNVSEFEAKSGKNPFGSVIFIVITGIVIKFRLPMDYAILTAKLFNIQIWNDFFLFQQWLKNGTDLIK